MADESDPAVAAVPAAVAGLDWRAIALGAGASLGIAYAANFLLMRAFAPATGAFTPDNVFWFSLVAPLLGLLADALGGALAGLLARRRGAMHGLLAAALASAGSLVVTLARFARYGGLMGAAGIGWALGYLFWTVVGLGVAAVAGMVAANLAARTPPPASN